MEKDILKFTLYKFKRKNNEKIISLCNLYSFNDNTLYLLLERI